VIAWTQKIEKIAAGNVRHHLAPPTIGASANCRQASRMPVRSLIQVMMAFMKIL
jgi:hypothetical protein